MAGWIFNQPPWRSFLAHGSEMKPNTALCLMFLSLALAAREAVASGLNTPVFFNPKMLPAVSKSLSALCAILALLTLFQYWFNIDLGIDQLLFKDVANPI